MLEVTHAESAPECLEWPVFAVRGESFTLGQVLGAADYLGLADEWWGPLEDSLVCETYAAEEGFEDDPEELQAAVDGFRYSRSLVSAEETERWLAERRLSEQQLFDALARERWRRRFEGRLDSIREEYAPHPGALAEALWPALLVHGLLRSMALALARRVVAPELLTGGEARMGARGEAGSAGACARRPPCLGQVQPAVARPAFGAGGRVRGRRERLALPPAPGGGAGFPPAGPDPFPAASGALFVLERCPGGVVVHHPGRRELRAGHRAGRRRPGRTGSCSSRMRPQSLGPIPGFGAARGVFPRRRGGG